MSTADLVVKRSKLSPVFLRRLNSQSISLGQKLKLEVEVGGYPNPKVTWYKDDKEISNDAINKVSNVGNSSILIVSNMKVCLATFLKKFPFFIV